jgi:predicted phosphodiesterase
MSIEEINIDKFPVVLFSDTHTNIDNIRKLKSLYPHNILISLGDNCDLYCKDDRNKLTIQYFIDNNIKSCSGNHDEHISGVVNGNTIMFLDTINKIDIDIYHLPKHQGEWLKTLPRGFKLNLSNKKHVLLYHSKPTDIWGRNDGGSLTKNQFEKTYSITPDTIYVIHGHMHSAFIEEYPNIDTKRVSIGALKFGEYAILNENGIHFRKL